MTHVVIPAILAYNRGDVFATISDCRAEGLENILKRYVLKQVGSLGMITDMEFSQGILK